jgi:hypothetical protein
MALWEDVQARLRRDYRLDVDDQDELALTLERTDAGVVRQQRVMVRRYIAWGRQMIELRSAFGEIGATDPVSLLVENLSLPLGSIALHGRYLVLVEKACLDDLGLEGMMFLLTRLSLLADVLEQRLGHVDRF